MYSLPRGAKELIVPDPTSSSERWLPSIPLVLNDFCKDVAAGTKSYVSLEPVPIDVMNPSILSSSADKLSLSHVYWVDILYAY